MTGKDSKPWDWYERLSVAASTAVQQWIMAILGYSEPGRKPPNHSDLSVEQMLMSNRTPPVEGNIPYPAFQLASASLSEHIGWSTQESENQNPPTQSRLVVLQHQDEINDMSQTTTPLPAPILRDSLQRTEGETETIAQDVAEAFEHMPSNPMKMLDADDKEILIPVEPPDIIQLPPPMQYLRALNPTEYAWMMGNTLAKVDITLQLARQEREGWNMLAVRIEEQLQQWDTRLKELEIERGYIQKVRRMVLDLDAKVAEVGDRIDQAESESKEATRNPLVSRQLGRELSRQRAMHKSPVAQPSSGWDRKSPAVTQYHPCEISLIMIDDMKVPTVVPILQATPSVHPLLHTNRI